MKRAWGTNGDWYYIDYTIGSDPEVKMDKFKLKFEEHESIEAKVLELVAARNDVEITEVRDCHIIRAQS